LRRRSGESGLSRDYPSKGNKKATPGKVWSLFAMVLYRLSLAGGGGDAGKDQIIHVTVGAAVGKDHVTHSFLPFRMNKV